MRGSDPAIALGGADEETSGFAIGNQYGVTANSLLLFELQTEVVALLTESPTLASQSVTVHPAKSLATDDRSSEVSREKRCVHQEETNMGRGILLWLIGIPIPIIILLALLWH